MRSQALVTIHSLCDRRNNTCSVCIHSQSFWGRRKRNVCACSHAGALSAAGARVTCALSVQARQRGDVHHADQRPLGLQPRGRARLRLPRPRHWLLPPRMLLPPDQAHPLLDLLSRSVWTCVVPSSLAARPCLVSTQVASPQGAVLQERGFERMRRAREANSLVVGPPTHLLCAISDRVNYEGPLSLGEQLFCMHRHRPGEYHILNM